MKHELKIKPEYFAAIFFGEKTFEIRNNADRNFQVGDTLLLKEWNGEFTGDFAEKVVSYITDFEQKPGYVVLGLVNHREYELLEKFHRTGVAIERAISTGSVLADHPLKSRLELLANHHKREQALADGMVAMSDRCQLLADLLREVTQVIPAIGVEIDDLPVVDAFLGRIEEALAGQVKGRTLTERQEFELTTVLQSQRDQLQSMLKAALDLLKQYRENRVLLHRVSSNHNHEELTIEYAETIQRIDSLLAGQVPDPAVTVTETIRTAPERIWLQVGDQAGDHDYPFPEHGSGVSWCAEQVMPCEVQYVRADLAGQVQAPTLPEGWELVSKATCFTLVSDGQVIASMAGPTAEGTAAILASVLAGQVPDSAVPDALVAMSGIASLQRYTLGGHCDSFGQDCGAEMERDDEGEYIMLAEALALSPSKQGGQP
ncbi:ASCH/PUA domain-containing protein [Aeromonas piscicola]